MAHQCCPRWVTMSIHPTNVAYARMPSHYRWTWCHSQNCKHRVLHCHQRRNEPPSTEARQLQTANFTPSEESLLQLLDTLDRMETGWQIMRFSSGTTEEENQRTGYSSLSWPTDSVKTEFVVVQLLSCRKTITEIKVWLQCCPLPSNFDHTHTIGIIYRVGQKTGPQTHDHNSVNS